MKRFFATTALALASVSAHAFTPTGGFWFDPAESGRGFTIEIQDATMVVASYVYSPTGAPTWYLTAGHYDQATSTFSGGLDEYNHGQCLGCSYVAPVGSPSAGGDVRIVFSSLESGTLYYPGGSSPIQHLAFGYDGQTGQLLGEWTFGFNISGLISSQWIVFSGYYTGSDGTVYARGNGDGNGRTLSLGAYEPSVDAYVVVIEDGVGYTYSYALTGDNARMIGKGWIEPDGTSISGNGNVAVASRILTPSEVAAVNAGSVLAPTAKFSNETAGDGDRLERLASVLNARLHAQE